MTDRSELALRAIDILRENDRGLYTVPTKGLYPFQWNWDSCFTALGQSHYDLDRAWTEIETLFAHQWPDGMVPHMVFHGAALGYFPGPEIWSTARPTPTSGITQLPIAGFAIHALWHRSGADERARALLGKLERWHLWFHRTRAVDGLVAIIHPWESRDNSIDWDEALMRVAVGGLSPYERNDLKHADPATRPTKAQYDRYLYLVQRFREAGWDGETLGKTSPFQIVDPGFNAILIRSCIETAALAEALGETGIAQRHRSWAEAGLRGLETLWSVENASYLPFDRVSGQAVDSPSIGGVLPIFAPIPKQRADAIAGRIASWGERVEFLVPSHAPDDPRYDLKRYWRGPVWLVCNALIADGLERAGEMTLSHKIRAQSLKLIQQGGFAEYYDPVGGAPLGGGRFSWTAAMVLEFVEPMP